MLISSSIKPSLFPLQEMSFTFSPIKVGVYGSNSIQAGFDAAGVTDAANSLKDPSVWGGVADFLTGGLTDFDGKSNGGLLGLLNQNKERKNQDYKNPGGGAWVYPNALRKAKQDFLKIDMLEYKPKQREDDHEGHCWLYMELEGGDEYISYDDGESWKEPDDLDWESFRVAVVEAHTFAGMELLETVCFLEPQTSGKPHLNL